MTGTEGAKGNPSLGSRAWRGAVWTFLSHGGAQALRLVGNLVMARLLFEEAFGIMALVNVFLVGLALFSDIGIGPSIIQGPRGEDPRFLNTAWTIQVGRGALLWLISCAGAVPFAAVYGEPQLASILPVAGLTAFILGWESTKLFTLNRNLHMGRLAAVELTSQAAGLVTMVVWGLLARSIWALVAGGIASALLKVLLSHLTLPGQPSRFLFDRECARALFRFGRWIFVSTAVTFLAQQSDRLILGRLIPLGLLGVYQIGLTLASMPTVAVGQLSARVVFPLLSRLNETGRELEAYFLRVRASVLVVAGWALSGLTAGGSAIVDILYDERYAQAGWIVQLTAVGCWLSVPGDVYGAALLSKGKSSWCAAVNVTKFLGMVTFILLGHAVAGFPGAVAGIVLAELLRLVVASVASSLNGVSGWKQDLAYSAMFAVASLAGWLADAGLAQVGAHVAARATAIFAVVTLAWLPLGSAVWRRLRRRNGEPEAPAPSREGGDATPGDRDARGDR